LGYSVVERVETILYPARTISEAQGMQGWL
jgi:hypothetical protein